METKGIHQNYFPLKADLRDFSGTDPVEHPDLWGGDDLLSFAENHRMSAFQMLVMMVKNTFEAHLFLVHDLRPDDLAEKGLCFIDGHGDHFIDLTGDFSDYFESYLFGLRKSWENIAARHNLREVSVEDMLNIIMANRIYTLPVQVLPDFDFSEYQQQGPESHQDAERYGVLSRVIGKALAESEIIFKISEEYESLFFDLTNQLNAKENILARLHEKLNLACNPLITNEEELEQEFFKTFVEREVIENPRRKGRKTFRVQEDSINIPPKNDLDDRIRSLYRTLCKNCREIHLVTGEEAPDSFLEDCFMKTNFIYNEPTTDLLTQLYQWFQLVALLTKVINYRKIKSLPVFFPAWNLFSPHSFTIKGDDAFLAKINSAIDHHTASLRLRLSVDKKALPMSDETMQQMHREFLKKQIDWYDEKIIQITEQIKSALNSKHKS